VSGPRPTAPALSAASSPSAAPSPSVTPSPTPPPAGHDTRARAPDLDLQRIDWQKVGGLLPAIVQHSLTGSVLMLGYVSPEALQATLERGRVVFYSRTRQRLWEKGETSGNTLHVQALRLDCDADTLLISALPAGPVCHTGTASCFGDEPLAAAARLGFLAELQQVIDARLAEQPEGSYTARLFARGPRRLAQKVGEEGVEVALAAAAGSDAELISESADLLFHLLLVLRSRSLGLDAVVQELQSRHTASGGR
jgi:phosphoribosyl-AMP cyclohydrolase / phosphoribosyl-ATP pyrophosphohydrolase